MTARVSVGLRVVAAPKQIERHCAAKRAMSLLEGKSAWLHIDRARYQRAARIVRRGLG